MAGPEGIDRMLAENNVVALIAPSTSRAWTNDREDQDNGQGSASRLPAVAGYPHLTVPMGLDRGMPVGISFIGAKWDDARILSLGYAYEQASPRPPRP
jgi:amidase